MAAKTKSQPSSKLPKAPLVEVVFELRWELLGSLSAQVPIRTDPGLEPLLKDFTQKIGKIGFGHAKEIVPAPFAGPHGIVRRFYREPSAPFPLMQVGPGIFASNESAQYEFKAFKKQVLNGVRVLIESYPKMSPYPLKPIQLELRYIDVFYPSIPEVVSFDTFIDKCTNMKLEFPEFVKTSKIFTGEIEARLAFNRQVKGKKNTRLVVDFGSGKANDNRVVRLESKVISDGGDLPKSKPDSQSFIKDIDSWLESAHSITSPFFKNIIASNLMKKFEQ